MNSEIITAAASIAARLTDEEIERIAKDMDVALPGVNYHFTDGDSEKIAAALRDYARLRKLAKEVIHEYNVMVNSRVTATIDGIEYYQPFRAIEVNKIKYLLAEAEKGESK